MSLPDLNQLPAGAAAPPPPERFDLKKHIHEEKPFITGFWMLVSVLLILAVLVASLMGGTYLLLGGSVPEFAQLIHPDKPEGGQEGQEGKEGQVVTQPAAKPLDQEVSDALVRMREAWNSQGSLDAAGSINFHLLDANDKREDSRRLYDPGTHIVGHQIRKITHLSDDIAKAEVVELFRTNTTMSRWYKAVEKSNSQQELYVERPRQYEYGLRKEGGEWKVSHRKPLSAAQGARIHQADDGEPDFEVPAGSPEIEDKRLTKEVVQPRYDGMALSLGRFEFPGHEVFRDYKLTIGDAALTPAQIQQRLTRAKSRIESMTVTALVEKVEQRNDVRAEAEVRYRAEFKLYGSDNLYVAVWRNKDEWATAQVTGNWYLSESERIYRSHLMEHYENLPISRQRPGSAEGE